MGTIEVLEEPLLEFRYHQHMQSPPDGLGLFGPYDTDNPTHPKNITYYLIGTENGINKFLEWIPLLNQPLKPGEKYENRLWPPFPGFDVAFCSELPEKAIRSHEIPEDDLIKSSTNIDRNLRAFNVVEMYIEGIKKTEKMDDNFDVIICVVPELIYKNCRPKSYLEQGWGYKPTKEDIKSRSKGQKSIFSYEKNHDIDDNWTIEHYRHSIDFRRQLKARSMKYKIPIQIVRESTLILGDKNIDINRGLTPISDRAWNLSTSLYYKSGAKPWKLATAREGVCYIGISFKRSEFGKDIKSACCAA